MSYGPISRSQLREAHIRGPESAQRFFTTLLWVLATAQLFVYGNQFFRVLTLDLPASVQPNPWLAGALFGIPLALFIWAMRTYAKTGTSSWLVAGSVLLTAVGSNVGAAAGMAATTSDMTRGLMLACTFLMLMAATIRHYRAGTTEPRAVQRSTQASP